MLCVAQQMTICSSYKRRLQAVPRTEHDDKDRSTSGSAIHTSGDQDRTIAVGETTRRPAIVDRGGINATHGQPATWDEGAARDARTLVIAVCMVLQSARLCDQAMNTSPKLRAPEAELVRVLQHLTQPHALAKIPSSRRAHLEVPRFALQIRAFAAFHASAIMAVTDCMKRRWSSGWSFAICAVTSADQSQLHGCRRWPENLGTW